jgi:hypothetical protein
VLQQRAGGLPHPLTDAKGVQPVLLRPQPPSAAFKPILPCPKQGSGLPPAPHGHLFGMEMSTKNPVLPGTLSNHSKRLVSFLTRTGP